MDQFNFFIIPIAAFVPLIIGFLWYSDGLFGKTWKLVSGLTEDQLQSGNKAKIIGLTYLFGLLAAYLLSFATVHQLSIVQLFFMDPAMSDPNSEFSQFTTDYLDRFGSRHRSLGHGAIHGLENGLLLSLAMIGIPALQERKNWKYIAIHVGFWTVCFGIMGALLCQFI